MPSLPTLRLTLVPLALLVLAPPRIAAQGGGAWQVSIPAPTAASLGKYGDIPVSLYSGTPQISVPLFTVKGKTLSLPISVDYHASGVRVEEIGSWVGTGWSLKAGGAITRTVRGLPDDAPLGYWVTGTTWYNSANWPTPSWSLLNNVHSFQIDPEPDLFTITLPGQTAQFVMGPTGTSTSSRKVRTFPFRRWSIQPTISGGITQWLVITEDGTRYTFASRETQYTDSPGPLSTSYTSTWYLTEMRAPGGDVVTFGYTSYVARHRMGVGGEQWVGTCQFTSAEYPSIATTTVQRLSSIVSAAHTVSFSTSLRTDAGDAVTGAQQEFRLDTMLVYATGGQLVRKFAFTYDYSLGLSTGSIGRLTLLHVRELGDGPAEVPPYSFTYTAPQLPVRSSYAVDHWGYYNGITSNSSYYPPGWSAGVWYPGANRRPYIASTVAGTLKRITYPTGGFSEFTYEANDYSTIYSGLGSMTDSGATQSGSATTSLSTAPQVTSSFTVGGVTAALVSISVFVSLPPSCSTNCPSATINTASGTPVPGAGPWLQSTGTSMWLSPGTYQLVANRYSYGTTVSISVTWQDVVTVSKKTGGGLRIAKVETGDGMGGVAVRRYLYTDSSDPARSSGVIDAEPRYGYTISMQDTYGNVCTSYSRAHMSKMPLGEGPGVVYKEVTILDGASGEYGKERHVFVVADIPPTDAALRGNWVYHRRTSNYWRWGSEERSEMQDSLGRVQRATTSSLLFRDNPETSAEFRGLTQVGWLGGPPAQPLMQFDWGAYRVEAKWLHPAKEITFTYDTLGVSKDSTVKTFNYGNPNHAQLTEVIETGSDQRLRVTRFKYPADYSPNGTGPEAAALAAMQADTVHMHAVVIERSVSERIGAVDKVVQADLTTYRLFGAGQYLPYQHFVLNSPVPIP